MAPGEAKKWARTRERGVVRFTLVAGVGRAGFGFFAVFATLDYLTRYGFECAGSLVVYHTIKWLPGSIVVGAVFGFFLYQIMEKRYRESLAEE